MALSGALRRADDQLRVALVTGACSGIGKAIATKLGSCGYELVIASEQADRLARVAGEIREAYGVTVHAIKMDLARPEAAEELYRAVEELGVRVDILVNNAGIFFFGETADASLDRANAMLQLHVVTPSLLCSRFVRDMRAARGGHVLIVSSISAWRDFPGISYYGSSKRYLRSFARALRSELAVYDVNVTCLAPGATATELYDTTNAPVQRAKRYGLMMDADAVAEAGLRAMFAHKAECVPGLRTRAMLFLTVLTPQWVIDLVRRRSPWLPSGQS